jgi:hypothetical protein
MRATSLAEQGKSTVRIARQEENSAPYFSRFEALSASRCQAVAISSSLALCALSLVSCAIRKHSAAYSL